MQYRTSQMACNTEPAWLLAIPNQPGYKGSCIASHLARTLLLLELSVDLLDVVEQLITAATILAAGEEDGGQFLPSLE